MYDPAAPENGADANSTAYVLMALSAVGEDAGSEQWSVDGSTAVDFLLSLQLPDGSLEWQAGTRAKPAGDGPSGDGPAGQVIPPGGWNVGACRR